MKKSLFILSILGISAFLISRAQVPFPGGGGGGGGSSATSQIAKTVLGSPAATISFTSIPNTFNQLKIYFEGASSVVATTDTVYVQFNGDTATNYNYEAVLGTATTASAAQAAATTQVHCGAITGSTGPAGESGPLTLEIPFYAGTTFRKHGLCLTGNEASDTVGNFFSVFAWFTWKSTAAINQITLGLTSGANFITGSSAALYGVN